MIADLVAGQDTHEAGQSAQTEQQQKYENGRLGGYGIIVNKGIIEQLLYRKRGRGQGCSHGQVS